jgi:hypothetical protein
MRKNANRRPRFYSEGSNIHEHNNVYLNYIVIKNDYFEKEKQKENFENKLTTQEKLKNKYGREIKTDNKMDKLFDYNPENLFIKLSQENGEIESLLNKYIMLKNRLKRSIYTVNYLPFYEHVINNGKNN